jgi:hypothetical protein
MRTVLLTAVLATLLLGFRAYGAERDATPVVRTTPCIAGAPLRAPTLDASADENCCNANTHCSQYITTQVMLKAPTRGRT